MNFHTFYSFLPLTLVSFSSSVSIFRSLRSDSSSLIKDTAFVSFLAITDALQKLGWRTFLTKVLPLSTLVFTSLVFLWVLAVVHIQRKVLLWSHDDDPEQEKCFLGKPLLFPSQLTHARMFPEKYHYGIDYFNIGMPVDFRGHIGALISFDCGGSNQCDGSYKSFIIRIFRKFTWFGMDPSQYLYRGDGHLSLKQKLKHFLMNHVCRAFRTITTVNLLHNTDLISRAKTQLIILTHI